MFNHMVPPARRSRIFSWKESSGNDRALFNCIIPVGLVIMEKDRLHAPTAGEFFSRVRA